MRSKREGNGGGRRKDKRGNRNIDSTGPINMIVVAPNVKMCDVMPSMVSVLKLNGNG